MDAVLTVMGLNDEYCDVAERLMVTLSSPPPMCCNCGEYCQWRFVGEYIDLALCAGCLICVPRRAGVMVCRRQEVGKQA